MSRIAVICVFAAVLTGLGCDGRPVEPVRVTGPLETSVRSMPWRPPSGVALSSAHYRIFTTAGSRGVRRHLSGFMEVARRHYLHLTGLADKPPKELMAIYLMATRQEWDALTRHAVGTSINISAGGYCYQGVCFFWDIGINKTLSVAAHEGLHQFFYHRIRDRLPMWMEEGMCTLAEGYELRGQSVVFTPERNVGRLNDLRRAIVQQHWRPLKKLLPLHSMEVVGSGYTAKAVGYYGQLWALISFIRSDSTYSAGLERMIADAEAGAFHRTLNLPPEALRRLRMRPLIYNRTVAEKLFRSYITNDLATFERRYRAFAEKLAMIR